MVQTEIHFLTLFRHPVEGRPERTGVGENGSVFLFEDLAKDRIERPLLEQLARWRQVHQHQGEARHWLLASAFTLMLLLSPGFFGGLLRISIDTRASISLCRK